MIQSRVFDRLPKYAKKWNWLQFEATSRDYGGYNGVIKAVDNDPRKSENDTVLFKEDTYADFIWAIRQYHKNHGRVGYDW